MNDKMNPLVQFSDYAGKLTGEIVHGKADIRREAENDVSAKSGQDRSLYFYAPKSGCPHAKQNQVLMVLRDDASEASAQKLLEELKLDELSEEEHFLVLFPDPQEGGWNYECDPDRDDDIEFLNRCFGMLRANKRIGVGAFNGMTFYLATTEAASAMMLTMAALRPINVPAMMIGQLPAGYELPEGALGVEAAAWCPEGLAADYLMKANGIDKAVTEADCPEGVTIYPGRNPECRLCICNEPISADTLRIAWDRLFCKSRRWQNDTYGTYQYRTRFTNKGFIGHVNDTSLGINDGRPETWFEYVPESLRHSDKKVPLVINCHGGGCVPLYAAEQSCWHDVADDEGFIVVYPEASYAARWNPWNDPTVPDDDAFIMALIEHMKETWPIDETRIYISGFSMGGMMSNAMAALHPDVFAAAAPCNAFHEGYFSTLEAMLNRKQGQMTAPNADGEVSETRRRADAKKEAKDYRMPLFQIAGLEDNTWVSWPITEANDPRLATFNYWRRYNNMDVPEFSYNDKYESGLASDETCYLGDDERFLLHKWRTKDEGGQFLYELLLAKRMPHALDLRSIRYAWDFMKHFQRSAEGELIYKE